MDLILVAVISLGAIGLIAAVILYAASKKFAVYEDPRIAKVSEVLPQANCGGCGYPGCSGFAGACVKAADAGSLEGKLCPVGGAPVMEKVAAILGLEAVAAEPKVAVVRCNGSCENRPRTALYDGAKSCAIAHATSGGETGCTFGCLGCGEVFAKSLKGKAITWFETTKLIAVNIFGLVWNTIYKIAKVVIGRILKLAGYVVESGLELASVPVTESKSFWSKMKGLKESVHSNLVSKGYIQENYQAL
jgi:RnfABCDGE-type electron transport complex B subunit